MQGEARIQTLPELLARQIARVTKIRAQWDEAASMVPASASRGLVPGMMLMDAALERAKRAAGSPDIKGQIAAVRELEGYTE